MEFFSNFRKNSTNNLSTTVEQVQTNWKFFVFETVKTLGANKMFVDRLKSSVNLQQVSTVDECDFILVFCPVVSRAGTDTQAAMKKLQNISDTKPAVLVVFHHTFDPHQIVADTWRFVSREHMISVDCLFHEDMGLLHCDKNNESVSKVTTFINSLEKPRHNGDVRKKSAPKPKNTNAKVENKTDGKQESGTQHQQLNTHGTKRSYDDDDDDVVHLKKRLANREEILKSLLEDTKLDMVNVNKLEKTLAGKDAELNEAKEKLQKATEQLYEKDRNLEEKNEKLKSSENKVKTLADTLTERDKEIEERDKRLAKIAEENVTLRRQIKEMQEKNRLLEENQRQLKEKETTLENTTKEPEINKQQSITYKSIRQETYRPFDENTQAVVITDGILEEKDTHVNQKTGEDRKGGVTNTGQTRNEERIDTLHERDQQKDLTKTKEKQRRVEETQSKHVEEEMWKENKDHRNVQDTEWEHNKADLNEESNEKTSSEENTSVMETETTQQHADVETPQPETHEMDGAWGGQQT